MTKFFVGKEVENTPFKDMDTLFVVDTQQLPSIIKRAEENKISHIYLGARQSAEWGNIHILVDLANVLILKGYFVTLDFGVSMYWEVKETLVPSPNLCLMIACRLPEIEQHMNVCLKVDDDINHKTNPGVWVHRTARSEGFTPWSAYDEDLRIE